jgi:hypothetical protein
MKRSDVNRGTLKPRKEKKATGIALDPFSSLKTPSNRVKGLVLCAEYTGNNGEMEEFWKKPSKRRSK